MVNHKKLLALAAGAILLTSCSREDAHNRPISKAPKRPLLVGETWGSDGTNILGMWNVEYFTNSPALKELLSGTINLLRSQYTNNAFL